MYWTLAVYQASCQVWGSAVRGKSILTGAPSLGQSDLVVRRGSAHKAASFFLYFLLRHETALVSGAKEDSFRAGGGVVLGVDWCHVQPSLSCRAQAIP